jgi:hypothetical protein
MKNRNRFLVGLMALIATVGLLFHQGDVGAASLATNVQVTMTGNLNGVVGLSTASVPLAIAKQIPLTNGVGANQADSIYTATYAIATGATQSIDVKGSLLDALGTAFTPAKLKTIYIYSRTGNTTNLTLFGDAAHVPILGTVATTMQLLPGGLFLLVQPPLAGIAVTAGTADIIKIVNAAGATANVDVILVGTSS